MAWLPISGTVPQYEVSGVAAVDHYLKFYKTGTTTPINMAIDSAGSVELAKCILDANGFPLNGSSAVFIPHINQTYKLVLYVNATDADNNTVGSAVWVVDSLTADSSPSIRFATVAAMVADNSLKLGDRVIVDDYATDNLSGPLFYTMVAAGSNPLKSGAEDGGSYINVTGPSTNLQAKANFPAVVTVDMFGASENLADNSTTIQAAIDFVQGTAGGRVKHLLLTNQEYTIASQLTFKDHSATSTRFPFTMSGLGASIEGSASTIKLDAGYTAGQAFKFNDTAGSGSNAYYNFRDFHLDGSSISTNGIDVIERDRTVGTVTLTGTSGNITGITVNSVEVMNGTEAFSSTLTMTAANIAASINTKVSSPDYTATSSGAVIKVLSATGGSNGFTVTTTESGGDIAATDVDMAYAKGTAASWTFERMTFKNIAGDALSIINGEVINILGCRFTGNTNCYVSSSGGLVGANKLNIRDSEFSSNAGWAVKHSSGTAFSFEGNTIQSNAVGGMHLSNLRAYNISGNHFEQNGDTGVSISTDSIGTIKADIILDGDATTTTFTNTSPCTRGVINANTFSSSTMAVRHIYMNAVQGLRVTNNNGHSDQLFATWGDNDVSFMRDVTIENNGEQPPEPQANPLDIIGVDAETQTIEFGWTPTAASYDDPTGLHSIESGVRGTNFAPQSFGEWTELVAEAPNTQVASFVKQDELFCGHTMWRLIDTDGAWNTATPSPARTNVMGVSLDTVPNMYHLVGKWIWFGIFANLSTVTNNNVGLYIEYTGATGPTYNHISTAGLAGSAGLWQLISMASKVPSAATAIQIGLTKLGSDATAYVVLSHPMLMQVGAPYGRAVNDGVTASVNMHSEHFGSAAPTTGTWRVGDKVWDVTPSAGGTMGWVCTTAGTPGTWKTFGAVTA